MTRDGGFSKMVSAGRDSTERPSTNRFYCFRDNKGVVLFGERATFPTRDELVALEMKTKRATPKKAEDGRAYFAYEHYPSREQAEANVDHYLASIRGSQTE